MNAALLWHGEKFRLRGKNAEIALTRLKNAKIDLYNVKKTEKDAVTFEVKGKQARKVFAIYPKTWYNKAERGGYEAISLGETGVFPRLKTLQKRAGLLAGAAAFLLITAFADNFVFDAVYTGDGALCRQARRIVRESGVTAFSRFADAQAEEISAKILSLDGASYASVQKKGTVLYVEARRSPFSEAEPMPGDMTAKHAGTLLSLTVLRGERAARPGAKIVAGTPLVYASLRSGEGESEKFTKITVSARAEIACTYEAETEAQTQAEALAVAKFTLAGTEKTDDFFIGTASAEQIGNGRYLVKIAYTAIETLNY